MELDLADAMGSCSTADEDYKAAHGLPPPLAMAPTYIRRQKLRLHDRMSGKRTGRRRTASERVRHVNRQDARDVVTAMIDSIFKNLLTDQNGSTGASIRHEMETQELTLDLARINVGSTRSHGTLMGGGSGTRPGVYSSIHKSLPCAGRRRPSTSLALCRSSRIVSCRVLSPVIERTPPTITWITSDDGMPIEFVGAPPVRFGNAPCAARAPSPYHELAPAFTFAAPSAAPLALAAPRPRRLPPIAEFAEVVKACKPVHVLKSAKS